MGPRTGEWGCGDLFLILAQALICNFKRPVSTHSSCPDPRHTHPGTARTSPTSRLARPTPSPSTTPRVSGARRGPRATPRQPYTSWRRRKVVPRSKGSGSELLECDAVRCAGAGRRSPLLPLVLNFVCHFVGLKSGPSGVIKQTPVMSFPLPRFDFAVVTFPSHFDNSNV